MCYHIPFCVNILHTYSHVTSAKKQPISIFWKHDNNADGVADIRDSVCDCYSSVSFMSLLAEICAWVWGWDVCSLFVLSAAVIAPVFITEVITDGSSVMYCVNAVLKSPAWERTFHNQWLNTSSVSVEYWSVSPESVLELHTLRLT